MIKAVIFDMDGLLIDSEPLWRKAEISIFKCKGIFLTENDCRRTTGMREDEVVAYWDYTFPDAGIHIQETIQEIMIEVTRMISTSGEALPGVYKTIAFFESLGIPMAIASASSYSFIDAVASKLGIKEKFAAIQSAEFMNYGKPHPEVFIETAKRLGVPVSQCLVFEDSIYGVIAGKAAKMKVVAIPDTENSNGKGYCIADKILPSMELFNKTIWDELNNSFK